MARRNKVLIQHVRLLLQEVRADLDIAISWIKAHTGGSSPEALGEAVADQLAARGRSGSSSAVVRPPVWTRRYTPGAPVPFLLRTLSAARAASLWDPRLQPVTRYLWPPRRAVVLHLGTTCRDRSRVPPVPPEAFGDVVGD